MYVAFAVRAETIAAAPPLEKSSAVVGRELAGSGAASGGRVGSGLGLSAHARALVLWASGNSGVGGYMRGAGHRCALDAGSGSVRRAGGVLRAHASAGALGLSWCTEPWG